VTPHLQEKNSSLIVLGLLLTSFSFCNRNLFVDSVTTIVTHLNKSQLDAATELVIAPPSLYLLLVRQLAASKIGVAAQNVYDKPNGAFTGELSVEQLKDAHIDWTIVGHSERRVVLKEDDDVGVSSLLLSCWGLGGCRNISLIDPHALP
jgi:Triosephosphate isomerase